MASIEQQKKGYKELIKDFERAHELIADLTLAKRELLMSTTKHAGKLGSWAIRCNDDADSRDGHDIFMRSEQIMIGEEVVISRRDAKTGLHIVEYIDYQLYTDKSGEKSKQPRHGVTIDSTGKAVAWTSAPKDGWLEAALVYSEGPARTIESLGATVLLLAKRVV